MCYAGRQLTDSYDAPVWPTAWVREGAASADRMTRADVDGTRRMADRAADAGQPEWAAKLSMFAAVIAARVTT